MHKRSRIKTICPRLAHAIAAVLLVLGAGLSAPMPLHGQGTPEASNNLHHDISPDGTRIVFESDRDGNSEIYLMNLDGSDLRRLTHHPEIDTAPVWSRDGKQILFRSTRETRHHPWPYYAMIPGGTEPVKVDDVDDYADVFRKGSPDETQVLLFKRSDGKSTDVFVRNADGTGEQRLTYEEAFDSDMSFSPDGLRIVYESILGEDVSTAVIMIMDKDGSNKAQLAGGTDPQWSPDGSHILYKARRADGECCDIFVMDANGANQTRLAEKGFFHRWLPDGSKIIYFSLISGTYQIYSMDPDGSNKQQLTRWLFHSKDH